MEKAKVRKWLILRGESRPDLYTQKGNSNHAELLQLTFLNLHAFRFGIKGRR
jgi:hypothetical protein